MQTYFTFQKKKIIPSNNESAVIHVFTVPGEEEKQQLIQKLGIDKYDFDAALDPDEISRVEFQENRISIIWKQPHKGSFSLAPQFDVTSVGFFRDKNKLTMIQREEFISFSDKIFDGANEVNDMLLRYFFHTIRQYLNHLKDIKQETTRLQTRLSVSMENKYFLQIFEISESLVYYLNAIEANGSVLEKLRLNAEKLNFFPQQKAFLDDIIQENKQCAKQAGIYSTVLSGLMDARGNIINNNMNVLLKNLTLINVIFLPLNLLASMGGMSEFTMIIHKYNINWQIGYLSFSFVMILIGWLTWKVINKVISPRNGNGY